MSGLTVADGLHARLQALSRLPSAQQPGDWAALATAVNALDDLLSMGGQPPAAWSREPWKPYAPKEASSCPHQPPIPGLLFSDKETASA